MCTNKNAFSSYLAISTPACDSGRKITSFKASVKRGDDILLENKLMVLREREENTEIYHVFISLEG